MRLASLVILVSAALITTALPAQAQWRPYVSRDFGFSFYAPGELSVERGVYQADTTGEYPTIVYRFEDNNIEYKATVVDFRDQAENGANLLEEAAYIFQFEQNVVVDAYGRVDTAYGRRVTINLPNDGGRTLGSFYFDRGYLFQLFATVLPANGDYGSPSLSRFIDSHAFAANRVDLDAIELGLPD